MVPSATMLSRLSTLLSTDTGTIAPAVGGVSLRLAKAAFVPSEATTLASLVEADFPGYAAVVGGSGNLTEYIDPITGLRSMNLKEPAGGWHFQSTGSPVPSQTIFGWYVTDAGPASLYAMELFNPPIVIDSAGQGIDVGTATFAIPPSALV